MSEIQPGRKASTLPASLQLSSLHDVTCNPHSSRLPDLGHPPHPVHSVITRPALSAASLFSTLSSVSLLDRHPFSCHLTTAFGDPSRQEPCFFLNHHCGCSPYPTWCQDGYVGGMSEILLSVCLSSQVTLLSVQGQWLEWLECGFGWPLGVFAPL